MFVLKNKYFLIIENIKDINLKNIKKYNKFIIIYRSSEIKDSLDNLLKFRKECFSKKIKFYIANNLRLCILLKSDGIYLSSYNKSFKPLNVTKPHFDIIGSAHNFKEIFEKRKQGCKLIILSKLFIVDYNQNSPYLGLIKYNKFSYHFSKKLIPLGGINSQNLNKLNLINSEGFALLSEVKKKPAKIFSRLF